MDFYGDFNPQPSQSPVLPVPTLTPWEKSVLLERQLKLLDQPYFDIIPVHAQKIPIDFLLEPTPFHPAPARPTIASTILSSLHCVDYHAMSLTTRAGIPDAILSYLNLNDTTGPAIFGTEGWQQITEVYTAFANTSPAPKTTPLATISRPLPQPLPSLKPLYAIVLTFGFVATSLLFLLPPTVPITEPSAVRLEKPSTHNQPSEVFSDPFIGPKLPNQNPAQDFTQ